MGTVHFLVKGGGRHELGPPRRLERMLLEACGRFGHGLKSSLIKLDTVGPSSENGTKGPLEISVALSTDLMEKLAPPFDPKNKNAGQDDTALRQFARILGETAIRLGPENGWPQRQVQIKVAQSDISWAG